MAYVTATEFLNSPFGFDFNPVSGSMFETEQNLDDFLDSISGIIDLFCGRSFSTGTYQEEKDSLNGNSIFVDNIPLVSVSSISYQTIGGTSGAIDSTYYHAFSKEGRVKFIDKLNPNLIYTVNYTAGYSTIPSDIKTATMMLAASYAKSIENGTVGSVDSAGVSKFKFGKFEESYFSPGGKQSSSDMDGIPESVYAILKRYKYMRL
jgi:hypothetical protein